MATAQGPALREATQIVERAMANQATRPVVKSFFDHATASVTHVLHDPVSRLALIADPVLDFEPTACRTSTGSVEVVLAYVERERLNVDWVLDSHIHADHLSAASWIREKLGAKIAIGSHVRDVDRRFADMFDNEPSSDLPFDRLFEDGDVFQLGTIECIALHVPGHTSADMAYVVGDVVLTGDTLFMPDFGTARADFPGGDAGQLFRSTRRLLSLPTGTRLLHCHDYPPSGRSDPAWMSTVGEQRVANVHVRDGVDEAAFIAMRTARDATLATPALMLAAVQVNVQGGRLPSPGANGRRYLKLPLDAL